MSGDMNFRNLGFIPSKVFSDIESHFILWTRNEFEMKSTLTEVYQKNYTTSVRQIYRFLLFFFPLVLPKPDYRKSAHRSKLGKA